MVEHQPSPSIPLNLSELETGKNRVPNREVANYSSEHGSPNAGSLAGGLVKNARMACAMLESLLVP